MVENPQLLVPSYAYNDDSSSINESSVPDAIYVPFKNRIKNIGGLLRELKGYEGPIYLLPTVDGNSDLSRRILAQNIEQLYIKDRPFLKFYASLRTSTHKLVKGHSVTWDLPMKRNFVIQHALTKNHRRVLLVDDDIRSIGKDCLVTGAKCLKSYVAAGCFVDDFVDTSVMGHLERVAGDPVYPFLSGSFLLLRPRAVMGFFPCVYNEDWLFMIPHILNRTICSFGTVGQLKFDPFRDSARSVFQEFGDLLVDGLYALLADNQYQNRHDKDVWSGLIAQRREFILSLSARLPKKRYQKIIAIMLNVSSRITPNDCLQFIQDWEKDLISWEKYIKKFK